MMGEEMMTYNNDLMNKEQLLMELDSLCYSGRMKRMALLGRHHKGDADYSALLVSLLESGTAYEAHLALTGASVVNDARAVLFALKHSKAGVRVRAAGLLPEVVTDPDFSVESEIGLMSYHCRRQLLRSILNTYRQDWAERLLPLVLDRWGAQEASLLLAVCSEETVHSKLPELGYALSNWRLLTKYYPDLVAAYFKNALQNATHREKVNIWWTLSSAIEVLSVTRPAIVLECALTLGPTDMIHPVLKQQLGILIQASPEDVFELLTREETREYLLNHGVPAGVLKKRKWFDTAQWTTLTSLLADQPVHVAKVLDTLAPSCREAMFDAAYKEDERKTRIFPMPLLDVLPHRLRDKEAARMLELRDIRDHRANMLETMARRLIVNTREKLEQAVQVSNSDERAAAYAHLIRSTALSRCGMDETLRFLTRIKNDQDPVRWAVMVELSNCPAPMFKEEHVNDLTMLVDSVVEARDTSYGTRSATEKLAFAILRENALEPKGELFKFALRTFGRLTMRDGQFALFSMDWDSIPSSALEALFDEIYAFGVEANKRENVSVVLRMADLFGKAVDRLPKLQLLLEELLKAKTVSPQAVHYWLAPYGTRDARVRELLDRDPSFISFHDVFIHLHLKRQEWLDPFISGKIIKGKHLSGKTIYVVPAYNGFHRWLPRQQKALASLLERVALDAKRSFHERAAAMRSLAVMPDYCSDQLEVLLRDQEVHVVEAALYAFSLWEEPEKALPVLLSNLDGDRARVAMYSIPRCMRRVSPVLLASMLSDLLNREKLKITVRKEAIRLLGAYKSSESMAILIREYEKPNVHKDVMIAIGHAARQWLDDERSWTMMSAMAASPQRDIARSLLNQYSGGLPVEARPRYLQLIIEIAGHADAVVAREAFQAMSLWVNGSEEKVAASTSRTILDLEDNTRWKAALDTLIVASRDGKVNDWVIGVCTQLADTETKAEWNAAPERDLPERQRLVALIDKLTSLPPNARRVLIPLYTGMIDALKSKETLRSAAIKLYLAIVEWNHADQAALHLDPVIQMVDTHPHLLDYSYGQIARAANASQAYWRPEAILDLVDNLRNQKPFAAQYIGLSLLKVAGTSLLWNQACTDRLRAYRNHEHEGIRLAALDIWTVLE
ncbi:MULTISPECIES: HEAT repeat domain-containing protein [Paenibacillus]|uniref:HEAT repeat domain-containing protein n=1 Tax=Paenibacillus TaxID=44249 RepID=UPI002041FF43|nr:MULTISPECIES: HEAT repeat domain-containing protein [Paenibacillus]